MAGLPRSWLAAAAGMLILAGCANMPGFGFLGGEVSIPAGISLAALASNGQTTFVTSVEDTSLSYQDLLRHMGLPVSVREEDSGVVRIKSFGPDQQEFTLVLSPDKPGSKTSVRIEWEQARVAKKSLEILLLLEKTKRPTTLGRQEK